MDVVRFKGGLGNQMFQYAFVEALRGRGREVKCSLGYYRRHLDLMPFVLDKVFKNVDLNEIPDEEFEEIDNRWKAFKEEGKSFSNEESRFFWVEESQDVYHFQEKVFNTRNCTYVGYWQTEKYFKACQERVRYAFQFRNLEQRLIDLGNELKRGYVGVHIRRKDYVDNSLYDVVTENYYRKAMNYIREIIPESKFIFFSDDMQWVKNHFAKTKGIMCDKDLFEKYEDWYDMYLMGQCVGNVIANSSFSWWGAWLNQNMNPLIIAPKEWLCNRETPDIYCESWIRM